MEYRPGKCSSCGAEYKIPASFQHDAAKCKECGGVVQIGPVQGPGGQSQPQAAGGAPIPARKVAEKPPATPQRRPQPEQPRKPEKKSGTLERLKAERTAPASEKKKGSTLERLKAERGEPAKAGAPKKAAAAAKPAAKAEAKVHAPTGSGRRPASARRRARGAGDEVEEERAGRRGRPVKQKGPNMILVAGAAVALIAGAAAVFIMMKGDDEGTQAAETADAGTGTETVDDGRGADAEPMDVDGADEGSGEEGGEDVDPAAEGGEDEAAAPEKPKPEKPKVKGDPDSVDLAAIPDFGRVKGTTDTEWDEMAADMEVWMDPWAGKKGNDARDRVLAFDYQAMPVIMNAFKRLDLSTEEGYSNGQVVQRAITDLCNGINFGWKSQTEENWLYFNKLVIKSYCTQWESAEDNIDYWIKWTKLDDKDPDKAAALRAKFGEGGGDALGGMDDGLDDLDVD